MGSVAAAGAAFAAAAETRLPSGQFITPTATPGSVFLNLNPGLPTAPNYLAGQAISTLVSPDKNTLVVLTSGYNSIQTPSGGFDAAASSEYIFFYDVSAGRPRQTQVLQIPTAYAGIAFSPDGQKLYVGSGGGNSVYTYALSGGTWAQSGTPVALGVAGVGNGQGPSTAGLAVSPDGTRLLVANIYSDSVSLVDLVHSTLLGSLDLRPGVENPAESGKPGGETPFWVTAVGNNLAYVTSQRDREVDALTLKNGSMGEVVARIPVEGTPVESIANRAGTRLYVAADNDDSVQVIDTATNKVIRRIPVAAPFGLLTGAPRYRGAAPNALALSADEKTLYVSNGGENAVAVVSLTGTPTERGLIPTGWYPNSVAVAHGWLYAVNGKSDPGPNPGNCNGSTYAYPSPPAFLPLCKPNQYVLQLEAGGLTAGPIPKGPTLDALTVQVAKNDNILSPPTAHDQSVMATLHDRIKHVIYIVKENRTYDQILGDLGRGNGDPTLVEFGAAITPNFHALSDQFVDLDNFEDPAEVSGNGWEWSTAGREPDFNVKTIPLDYSSRPTNAPYNSEGQVRDVDVGQATTAQRQISDPAYPNDPNLLPGTGQDDEADGPADDEDGPNNTHGMGYVWNAALAAGLSVRNYGFFDDLDRYGAKPGNYGAADPQIPEDVTPFKDGVVQAYNTNPALIPVSDPYFRGFDNAYPDYYRVQEWNREFQGYEAKGTLPSLTLLRLMHDHMGKFSTALDGINTPELEQADDDYAVGLVAQTVAQSPDAGDTLIFVVEDDAQDGPDHVDAHRSTAYIVGPYVRQGAVVHHRYTTINMLATIEDVLGMQHLNLNDATQVPMTDAFDLGQSTWSYTATPSQYLYGTTLPLPTRQADAGPIPRSTHDAAWWTAATHGYDWTHEDRVPAVAFNEVVWHGLFGARPYPTTRSGTDLTPASAHPGEAKIVR